MAAGTLLLACGALAHELVELQKRNQWEHIRIQCLPADLHNTPQRIPGAVDEALEKYKSEYEHIFVAYADCGTGGLLDRVLERHNVQRIPGAHCYQFFAGASVFDAFSDEEPGTFYLTDFLARHFDRLIVESLGLDRHPELKEQFFGNYKRLVYLAQTKSETLSMDARSHAEFLGLEYIEHYTGLEPVESVLKEQEIRWQN